MPSLGSAPCTLLEISPRFILGLLWGVLVAAAFETVFHLRQAYKLGSTVLWSLLTYLPPSIGITVLPHLASWLELVKLVTLLVTGTREVGR